MKEYLYEILFLLGPDKRRLPRLLFLFLFASILDLVGIGLIGPYVSVITDDDTSVRLIEKVSGWLEISPSVGELMVLMSVILLVIFTIKAIVSIWINYVIINFSSDQQVNLRSLLMKKYQSMEYVDYIDRNSSEYIHNTQTLVHQYSAIIIHLGLKMFSDGIVVIAILALLIWVDFIAFLVLIGLIGLVTVTYDYFFRKKVYNLGVQANISATSMIQGIHEGIEGLKEIRVLGSEEYFYKKVVSGAKKYGEYQAKSTMISTSPRYLLELIVVLFIVFTILTSIYFDRDLQLLLPTLGMFGLASIRLLPAVNTFSTGVMQFRFHRNTVNRLYKDVRSRDNYFSSIDKYKENIDKEVFNSLSVKNICFNYPGSKVDTISGLSLEINMGESIGLIGSSGSGKTTLIDVLLGLLTPQQGVIEFNAKPLSDAIDAWRSNVAYLPQHVFLIDSSLKENIALGVDENDIDMQKIMSALEKSQLAEMMENMPNGVETIIGENGVKLSGGQRQRIALARAFYHDKSVLIMDESTSSLDNETESEIINEIQLLKGSKTMIVIAHRISTILNCDKVYKMEKGSLVYLGDPKNIVEYSQNKEK
jgi:ATP-binding cassette, subfamily B, bacterial PglK